ncbi:MAG: Lrp/AsnC family transcriptional regulator [Burkholderiales bacterium]|nr:Lrp/AsnC family transcriptional regulator [Burkholderiales bacterium]
MSDSLALLNPWQRGFPLLREPFAPIAAALNRSVPEVLAGYAALQANGSLSRIGGVFGPGAGGAALLAAMAVPASRLQVVAERVSAHPGVNHNYQREHRYNLWFVMTGRSAEAVAQAMAALEQATGLPALRLRMQRAYRIDLGFDLRHRTAPEAMPAARGAAPIADADLPLAALVEEGLPLLDHPFDAWAQALGRAPEAVLATLQHWLASGTLKRFGTIVRHHELGFDANAMTVFNLPDALVDGCGEALAREPGVTLAYRRERAPEWPYNLYCMVHGRDREAVLAVLARAVARCGLQSHPQQTLFSLQRYKQTGARRFRELPTSLSTPLGAPTEAHHAVA